MSDDESETETQTTDAGLVIPVPEKRDVMRDFLRAARRKPDDSDARRAEDER